jgi:hypothetical protein
VTFVVYGALGGALFLLPLELQQVSAYTPLAAGVSLLPITALMLLLSSRSGALAARIGPRLQMSAGPVLVGLGLGLFVRIGPTGDYLTQVLPAITVLGFGLAVTVAPLTAPCCRPCRRSTPESPRRSTTTWPGRPPSSPSRSSRPRPASPVPPTRTRASS